MNLQPLYDVKERLENAAIAGTGLLGEDFRLQRAAEGLKPLAAASPVFGKISAGLDKLLSAPAEARSGLLLDLLALVDAVAYTQGHTGAEGELSPLPAGAGACRNVSYGQLRPLIAALTTTGGGRLEVIKDAWENHPEFFSDFRVLPALITGLADSYGEIGELNTKILKQTGAAALPLLKENFDPAGKKEMARRVEVISALEGAEATPWLREILPQAKKDVRSAVIEALGTDIENIPLLLDLSKTERGGSRDAVLKALSRLDSEAVQAFWRSEVKKNSASVLLLWNTDTRWAAELVAAGLRERMEKLMTHGDRVSAEEQTDLSRWCQAVGKKDFPVMLDFWRWADEHMETFDKFTNEKGNPVFAGVRLTDTLRDSQLRAGPGPLRDLCLKLWEGRPSMTRYLIAAFQAALLSSPAAEVYEKFSPYILTRNPILDADYKKTCNTVLLRVLGEVSWDPDMKCYVLTGGRPIAEPLDIRWIERLTQAVQRGDNKRTSFYAYWENVPEFDFNLMRLIDLEDEAVRKLMVPYLRKRMEEVGQPHTYGRWLFQLGGSPKGLLGKAMARDHKTTRLAALWNLMNEGAKALPPEEMAELLEEILASNGMHKSAQPDAQRVIPLVAELLRAGQPFPDWDDWLKLCK